MKSKTKILAGLICTVCIAGMYSCEEDFYKDEMYRKEVYIVSGENNIYGEEFTYGGSEGSLSIYVSGTVPVKKDVEVVIGHDPDALRNYNIWNHDTNYDNYALEIPESSYRIESSTVVIKPDAENPYTLFPVTVTIDGLDPDETHFLPLRIESVSDYMYSESKNFVLYRIYFKNLYATTKTNTYYIMSGTSQAGTMSGGIFTESGMLQPINSSKLVTPVGANSVRIFPAATTQSGKNNIRLNSITVTVHPDVTVEVPVYSEGQPTGETASMQKVTMAPYLDSEQAVLVEDIPGEISSYDPDTGVFYLYYRYRLSGNSNWYEIRETMVNFNY